MKKKKATQKVKYAKKTAKKCNLKKLNPKNLIRRIPRPIRRGILTAFLTLALCAISLGILVLSVSIGMKDISADRVMAAEAAAPVLAAGDFDCILVLGAGVRPDGTPTPMLYDRVQVACDIYTGDVPLLMSGDHTGDYNEVGAMKRLAEEKGVLSEDIFLDHEGYSTYESLYRAKEKFGARKIVIVSQGYHLYRALFIARELGMDAVGVTADLRDYYLQTKYEVREVLARFKDLYVATRGDKPCEVGERIDLSGDGNLT